jgi:hypothetical protein
MVPAIIVLLPEDPRFFTPDFEQQTTAKIFRSFFPFKHQYRQISLQLKHGIQNFSIIVHTYIRLHGTTDAGYFLQNFH